MKILVSLVFIFFTTSSFAVTFDGKFIQGSFILGKTEPGSEVFIDKKKVKVTSDGYFAFGLGRDRKNDNWKSRSMALVTQSMEIKKLLVSNF